MVDREGRNASLFFPASRCLLLTHGREGDAFAPHPLFFSPIFPIPSGASLVCVLFPVTFRESVIIERSSLILSNA